MNKMRPGLKGFFKDPNNLKYNLNIIVPLIVFLTSLLCLAIGANILAPIKTSILWVWILAACLFCSVCSFVIMRAMTQPLTEVVRKAEQFIKLEEFRKNRGKMIEVYNLIERLTEYIRSKANEKEQSSLMRGIENLDYIVPLGYMSLMVAHEVRNPLTTITGMSELLMRRITDESQRRYIQAVLDAAKRIGTFTSELLDFTDDEVEKEEFDVNDVVDEVRESLAQGLENVTSEFPRGGPVRCFASRIKIYQVIQNIVKNAIDHEKAGGYIRVATTREGDDVCIFIHNRHSTISEEDCKAIFKPFFTKKKDGKGLGLFIAMRNIRLHGGNITVKSGDQGTTFIIRFPSAEKSGSSDGV